MKKVYILLLLFMCACAGTSGETAIKESSVPSVQDSTPKPSKAVITTSSTTSTSSTTTTTTVPVHLKVPSIKILEFNLNHPVYKDKLLRQSIVCIFDRDFVLGSVLQYGKNPTYNSLIPPSFVGESGYNGIAEDYDCDFKEFSDRYSYVINLLQENYDADDWYANSRCTQDTRCVVKNLTSKSTGINISKSQSMSANSLACGPGDNPEISTLGLFLSDYSSRIGINTTARGFSCELATTSYVNSDSFRDVLEEGSICKRESGIRISKVYVNNLYDYFNSLVSQNKYCYGFNFTNIENEEINNLVSNLEQDKNNLEIAKKIEEILISNYIIFPISTINEERINTLEDQLSREEKGSDREYDLLKEIELYIKSPEEFSMFIATSY
jgi:hypothetical protein